MTNRPELLRQWLAERLDKAGHGSKSRLAQFMGLNSSQITRMIATAGEKRDIKAHELLQIEEFFGEQAPGGAPSPMALKAAGILENLPEELQKEALDHLRWLQARAGNAETPPDQSD